MNVAGLFPACLTLALMMTMTVRAWTMRRLLEARRASASSLSSSAASSDHLPPKRSIAIVGGGLAGLSTAFHLVNKMCPGSQVTVFDKAPVGTGGASAVAGGLMHPLTPRGKLAFMGLEGLEATNRLVEAASCEENTLFVLRDELYRIALTPEHAQQLQTTAQQLSRMCTWLSPLEMQQQLGGEISGAVLGGLRMSHGCKVIHVPSYLQALWKACQTMARAKNISTSWDICNNDNTERGDDSSSFDTVVYAAGSGLFEQSSGLVSSDDLPIQLVRGQSLELNHNAPPLPALLCGKYVSPLPTAGRVLVGATHEFGGVHNNNNNTPWDLCSVRHELQTRTEAWTPPWLWQNSSLHRVTSGTRVQSARGKCGRLPIMGRWWRRQQRSSSSSSQNNIWILTGLSSRGLLYHGLCGDILTDAILEDDEESMYARFEGWDWWKKTRMSSSSG